MPLSLFSLDGLPGTTPAEMARAGGILLAGAAAGATRRGERSTASEFAVELERQTKSADVARGEETAPTAVLMQALPLLPAVPLESRVPEGAGAEEVVGEGAASAETAEDVERRAGTEKGKHLAWSASSSPWQEAAVGAGFHVPVLRGGEAGACALCDPMAEPVEKGRGVIGAWQPPAVSSTEGGPSASAREPGIARVPMGGAATASSQYRAGWPQVMGAALSSGTSKDGTAYSADELPRPVVETGKVPRRPSVAEVAGSGVQPRILLRARSVVAETMESPAARPLDVSSLPGGSVESPNATGNPAGGAVEAGLDEVPGATNRTSSTPGLNNKKGISGAEVEGSIAVSSAPPGEQAGDRAGALTTEIPPAEPVLSGPPDTGPVDKRQVGAQIQGHQGGRRRGIAWPERWRVFAERQWAVGEREGAWLHRPGSPDLASADRAREPLATPDGLTDPRGIIGDGRGEGLLPASMQGSGRQQPSLPVSDQLSQQIVSHAETAREREQTEFRVRLEPPELGTVHVHLRATEHTVAARLVVTDEVTRQLLESRWHALRDALAGAGVVLQRFDVRHEQGGRGGWRGREDEAEALQAVGGLRRASQPSRPIRDEMETTRVIDVVI